jgi:hypothetical protein
MDQPKTERVLRLMKVMTGNNNYTVEDKVESMVIARICLVEQPNSITLILYINSTHRKLPKISILYIKSTRLRF